MRIMGIDASVSSCGIAIYDTKLEDFITVTKIRTSIKKATPTLGRRVEQICIELSHLLFLESVDIVVIEDIYVNKVSSAIPLAMLRGGIQQTVYGLDYDSLLVYGAKQVKKAVTGNGNASKEDMYKSIKKLYGHLPLVKKALGKKLISLDNADKNEDMADACGVIHTYLQNPSLAKRA